MRFGDIAVAVGLGRLNPEVVLRALQDIAEDVYIEQPHPWYVAPERQLDIVKRLNRERFWGLAEDKIPTPPRCFTPRSATEILMLSVGLRGTAGRDGLRRTVEELWSLIVPPSHYAKHVATSFAAGLSSLRLVPGHLSVPGIRWVAFDPVAYHELPANEAFTCLSGDVRLAGTEVLIAALLFPGWAARWSWLEGTVPEPYLAGLRLRDKHSRTRVPQLRRWDGDELQLQLTTEDPDCDSVLCCSRTVRWV